MLLMLLIGKSKKPRSFLGITRSRMSGDLFEEWMYELDKKFHQERWTVVMIIDNCPAHPHIENLKVMSLVFLTKKNASITQPIDQGVTQSLKVKYCTILVRPIIASLDNNKSIPKLNILEAIYILT